jgi:hypothetical protein
MRRSDPKRMSYFPTFADCLQIILEIDSTLDLLHLLSYVLMIHTSGRMVIPLYSGPPRGASFHFGPPEGSAKAGRLALWSEQLLACGQICCLQVILRLSPIRSRIVSP